MWIEWETTGSCPDTFPLRFAHKLPLCHDTHTIISFRLQVTKERGEQLAVEYGIKFVETSAKASINVEEAFYTLASDIKAKMEKRLVRDQNKFIYKFYVYFRSRLLFLLWYSDPYVDVVQHAVCSCCTI